MPVWYNNYNQPEATLAFCDIDDVGQVYEIYKKAKCSGLGDKPRYCLGKTSEPFPVIGRLTPRYENGMWSTDEVLFTEPYEKAYPQDEIDCDAYIDNPARAVYLYFVHDECVGQIRIRANWNRYCYIEDIAVSKAYRSRRIGSALIGQARVWAEERGLCGMMLETQDVNLIACRFYQKCGFTLGAADTMLYRNFETRQEIALFWYMLF